MKCSKLPFSTEEELLKPIIQDPTKFSILLLRFQHDFQQHFYSILQVANDETKEEDIRHRCHDVVSAFLPLFATSLTIIDLFHPTTTVYLDEYKGLKEAYTYIRSLIDNKLDDLCQPSQMPLQESASTSQAD